MTRCPEIASTIDYYNQRKRKLLASILERNGEKLPKAELLFCQKCYSRECEVEELHIHHVNENGKGHHKGGWQALYKHEEDFEAGVDLVVWCKACHLAHHQLKSFYEEKIDD